MSAPPSGRGQNRPIGVPRRSVGNSRHRNSPSSSVFAPSSTDSTNASSVVSRLARSIGNPPMPGRNHSGSRSSIAVDIGTGTSGVGSTGSRSGIGLSARMMLDASRRRTAATASNEPRQQTGQGARGNPHAVRVDRHRRSRCAGDQLVAGDRQRQLGAHVAAGQCGCRLDGPASRLVAPITVVKLADRATPWFWATLVATHIDVAAAAVVSMVAVFSRAVTTSFVRPRAVSPWRSSPVWTSSSPWSPLGDLTGGRPGTPGWWRGRPARRHRRGGSAAPGLCCAHRSARGR